MTRNTCMMVQRKAQILTGHHSKQIMVGLLLEPMGHILTLQHLTASYCPEMDHKFTNSLIQLKNKTLDLLLDFIFLLYIVTERKMLKTKSWTYFSAIYSSRSLSHWTGSYNKKLYFPQSPLDHIFQNAVHFWIINTFKIYGCWVVWLETAGDFTFMLEAWDPWIFFSKLLYSSLSLSLSLTSVLLTIRNLQNHTKTPIQPNWLDSLWRRKIHISWLGVHFRRIVWFPPLNVWTFMWRICTWPNCKFITFIAQACSIQHPNRTLGYRWSRGASPISRTTDQWQIFDQFKTLQHSYLQIPQTDELQEIIKLIKRSY